MKEMLVAIAERRTADARERVAILADRLEVEITHLRSLEKELSLSLISNGLAIDAQRLADQQATADYLSALELRNKCEHICTDIIRDAIVALKRRREELEARQKVIFQEISGLDAQQRANLSEANAHLQFALKKVPSLLDGADNFENFGVAVLMALVLLIGSTVGLLVGLFAGEWSVLPIFLFLDTPVILYIIYHRSRCRKAAEHNEIVRTAHAATMKVKEQQWERQRDTICLGQKSIDDEIQKVTQAMSKLSGTSRK